MDNQQSGDHSDDNKNQSSHDSTTEDTNNFGFNSFGQYYLDQLDQINKMNQSFFDKSKQTANPFEANMKLWQDSMSQFGQFMTPNMAQSADESPSDTSNAIDGITDFTQKFMSESLKRAGQDDNISQSIMLNIIDGWQNLTTGVTEKSPTALIEKQMMLWQQQVQ
ncbi:hypothetical protein ACTXGO_12290, partial [Psychrobacter sp. T6-1]|uniref:hypothetical protein n=1 Tax=Psychrobacter sp. T6-1 TaxID=3457447 RepID=UPI003FCF58A0